MRIIYLSDLIQQASDQACQLMAQKKKTKTKFFALIIAKTVITQRIALNL